MEGDPPTPVGLKRWIAQARDSDSLAILALGNALKFAIEVTIVGLTAAVIVFLPVFGIWVLDVSFLWNSPSALAQTYVVGVGTLTLAGLNLMWCMVDLD